MWDKCQSAFAQKRCHHKAGELACGTILNYGRHTITGMLSATGAQNVDWSAAYRLFQNNRFDRDKLFNVALEECVDKQIPLVCLLDDTLLRKSGRKVPGTSWKRDPLGPKFAANLIWGQRFFQMSAAVPTQGGRCRAVPIDITHCPVPKKPGKLGTETQWEEYRRNQKMMRAPAVGSKRIGSLRKRLDAMKYSKKLYIVGDGGYTNSTILKQLPDNTEYIGRLRKDAKLYSAPTNEQLKGRGRTRIYGDKLPSPEELRQNENIPWQEFKAATGDKEHTFCVKIIRNVRSKIAGKQNLTMMIIRPLRYRLSINSRLLYRNPAYIITTDNGINIQQMLQNYLWRWEIELNFKDQKSIMGIHEPHVRNKNSVANVPAFMTAVYSMLILAGNKIQAEISHKNKLPKWRSTKKQNRLSTTQMQNIFRQEILEYGLKKNFNSFSNLDEPITKPLKFNLNIFSAMCNAVN